MMPYSKTWAVVLISFYQISCEINSLLFKRPKILSFARKTQNCLGGLPFVYASISMKFEGSFMNRFQF